MKQETCNRKEKIEEENEVKNHDDNVVVSDIPCLTRRKFLSSLVWFVFLDSCVLVTTKCRILRDLSLLQKSKNDDRRVQPENLFFREETVKQMWYSSWAFLLLLFFREVTDFLSFQRQEEEGKNLYQDLGEPTATRYCSFWVLSDVFSWKEERERESLLLTHSLDNDTLSGMNTNIQGKDRTNRSLLCLSWWVAQFYSVLYKLWDTNSPFATLTKKAILLHCILVSFYSWWHWKPEEILSFTLTISVTVKDLRKEEGIAWGKMNWVYVPWVLSVWWHWKSNVENVVEERIVREHTWKGSETRTWLVFQRLSLKYWTEYRFHATWQACVGTVQNCSARVCSVSLVFFSCNFCKLLPLHSRVDLYSIYFPDNAWISSYFWISSVHLRWQNTLAQPFPRSRAEYDRQDRWRTTTIRARLLYGDRNNCNTACNSPFLFHLIFILRLDEKNTSGGLKTTMRIRLPSVTETFLMRASSRCCLSLTLKRQMNWSEIHTSKGESFSSLVKVLEERFTLHSRDCLLSWLSFNERLSLAFERKTWRLWSCVSLTSPSFLYTGRWIEVTQGILDKRLFLCRGTNNKRRAIHKWKTSTKQGREMKNFLRTRTRSHA